MIFNQLYQERHKTTGIEINIGERGVSIEKSSRQFLDGALEGASIKAHSRSAKKINVRLGHATGDRRGFSGRFGGYGYGHGGIGVIGIILIIFVVLLLMGRL